MLPTRQELGLEGPLALLQIEKCLLQVPSLHGQDSCIQKKQRKKEIRFQSTNDITRCKSHTADITYKRIIRGKQKLWPNQLYYQLYQASVLNKTFQNGPIINTFKYVYYYTEHTILSLQTSGIKMLRVKILTELKHNFIFACTHKTPRYILLCLQTQYESYYCIKNDIIHQILMSQHRFFLMIF
jgi:hypothetical protein